MKRRHMPLLAAAVLSLAACGSGAPAPQADAPTTPATASTTTAPTPTPSTPAVTPTEATTTASAPASHPPVEQARLEDFTAQENVPLPDPQYFLSVVAQRTRQEGFYRVTSTRIGHAERLVGYVDVTDGKDPKADLYLFGIQDADPGGVHIVLAGGDVYAQLPKVGAHYARTRVADLPDNAREGLATILDPFAGMAGGTTGGQIVYAGSEAGPQGRHFFRSSTDPSQIGTYTEITVDPQMRVLVIGEFENGSYTGSMTMAEYGQDHDITVPPKRLLVEVPKDDWNDLGVV